MDKGREGEATGGKGDGGNMQYSVRWNYANRITADGGEEVGGGGIIGKL